MVLSAVEQTEDPTGEREIEEELQKWKRWVIACLLPASETPLLSKFALNSCVQPGKNKPNRGHTLPVLRIYPSLALPSLYHV